MSFQIPLRIVVCVAGLAAAAIAMPPAQAKVVNLTDNESEEVSAWTERATDTADMLLAVYDRISVLGDLADGFLKGEVSRTRASKEFKRARTETEDELAALAPSVKAIATLPEIGHKGTVERAFNFASYLKELQEEIGQSVGEADDEFQRALSWDTAAEEELRALFAQKYVARIEADVRVAELNERLLHRENPEKYFYRAAAHTNKAISSIAELAVTMIRNDGEYDRGDPRIQAARAHTVEAEEDLGEAQNRLTANNRKLTRKAKYVSGEDGLTGEYDAIFAQSFAHERQFLDAVKKLVDFTARANPGMGPKIFEAFIEHLPAYLQRRSEAAEARREVSSRAGKLLRMRPPPRAQQSKNSIF